MTTGIHHITAMCGDPQANVDFYTKVLGLRLVKVNVNMDDPGTYHFYFGDRLGSPGTAMTFFPWPGARRGVVGKGQVAATAFSVPKGSLRFWQERLGEFEEFTRFDAKGLMTRDPDGMPIELIEADDDRAPWHAENIPIEFAIRGFHSATLWSFSPEITESLLVGTMGFRFHAEESGRRRLVAGDGSPHQIIDIGEATGQLNGQTGVGACHHIAFRVPDSTIQRQLSEKLNESGIRVTPVQERFYFQSVYFREPGHVLFEIATDEPGFTADESAEHLGEKLCLPPWFEPNRATIEASLPRFVTPNGVSLP